MAGKFVFPYMSMTSLLSWRATCRDNYLVATYDLRRFLHALILRFFPDPRAFLQQLTRWGAFIIGEGALSVVLHDSSICNNTLEIAVGSLVFDPFVHRLESLLPFGTHLSSLIEKPAPISFPSLRHITRIAEFQLKSGLIVEVYESTSPSACDVVCGAWTTALMNFVTEFSLGCAYPRLTLNYRGTLCDGRVQSTRWRDQCTHDGLMAKGFEFAHYSSTWSQHIAGPYVSSIVSMTGCRRDLYICPTQGRYFGDPGSLVLFFQGLFANMDIIRDSCVAPYGTMSAWRIPSKEECVSQCVKDASVVPPYVISLLIRFVEDTRFMEYRVNAGEPSFTFLDAEAGVGTVIQRRRSF